MSEHYLFFFWGGGCNFSSLLETQTKWPLMTTKNLVESAWAEDMGQFLYYLDLDTRKITSRLEKLQLKINSVPSSFIKLALITHIKYVIGEHIL